MIVLIGHRRDASGERHRWLWMRMPTEKEHGCLEGLQNGVKNRVWSSGLEWNDSAFNVLEQNGPFLVLCRPPRCECELCAYLWLACIPGSWLENGLYYWGLWILCMPLSSWGWAGMPMFGKHSLLLVHTTTYQVSDWNAWDLELMVSCWSCKREENCMGMRSSMEAVGG